MIDRPFLERPLAITDIECTGIDLTIHEIAEIGLLVVDQKTFEILDSLDVKVRPEHIETAALESKYLSKPSRNSLEVIGYSEELWAGAIPLKEAMRQYAVKVDGAIFCAWNMNFDYGFLQEAFRKTEILNPMDYHMVDLFTMAFALLRNSGLERFHLSDVAKFLGIPQEPEVHRAMNGTRLAYEVYKNLSGTDRHG